MKNTLKKKIAFGLISLCLILSTNSVIRLAQATSNEDDLESFIYASQGLSGLSTLDPVTYYQGPEGDVVHVVTEGLTGYRVLQDRTTDIVPVLATEWEYVDALTLDITLREDVSFSDGTPWNATSCKWNWDRVGNLYTDPWIWAKFSPLFNLPADPYRDVEGVDLSWAPEYSYIYIINDTEIISEYEFRFNLNVPFDMMNVATPFMGMISPVAHADYANATMPWAYENKTAVLSEGLIGTGGFILDEINFAEEIITLHQNPNYWGGELDIDLLTFRYFGDDPQAMSVSLAAGDIDACRFADKDLLQENEDVVFFEEDQVGQSNYIGMFPEKVDIAVREAFNYAFDQQYFIDEIAVGETKLPTGAIFPGQSYQNDAVSPPAYNITKARQILIDAEIAPAAATNWTDDDWKDVADGDGTVDPLADYTLGYMDLYSMASWATQMVATARTIGINITSQAESEANYWGILGNRTAAPETFDMFTAMMSFGLSPEFNFLMMYDTYAFFPESMPIGGDAEVTEAIWNFMTTPATDTETRQEYADAISNRINNELFVFTWIPVSPWAVAHSAKWTNINSVINFRPQDIELASGGSFLERIPGFDIIFLGISSSIVIAGLVRKKRK